MIQLGNRSRHPGSPSTPIVTHTKSRLRQQNSALPHLQSGHNSTPIHILAQTRQADRDKAHAEADALHREDIARAVDERQAMVAQQTVTLVDMVKQNTQLTETIKVLTERVETLTIEVHKHVTSSAS
jgi:predicted naringenin-chalcone synthase